MLELEEDLKASQNPYQVLSNPGVLPVTFLTISGELEEILEEKNLEEELRKEILEFYFVVRDFLNVSELVDENYVVYTECFGENDFRLRLFCVNPAANLSEYLKKGRSAVFFPQHFFRCCITGNFLQQKQMLMEFMCSPRFRQKTGEFSLEAM